jgi:hypothetical protein
MKVSAYILILAFSASLFSADIRYVNKTPGIDKIKLGITMHKALYFLYQKRLELTSSDIACEEIATDPYKIIRTNILSEYRKNIKKDFIAVRVTRYEPRENRLKNEDYFFDLLDASFDKRFYTFSNRNSKYYISYKRIKIVTLNEYKASHVNPLLKELRLTFYNNILFKIEYKANMNLDQLERYILNYRKRLRVREINGGKNIFFQSPYRMTLTFENNLKDLLEKIDIYRNTSSMFKNHTLIFEAENVNFRRYVRLYKASVYDNFSRDIVSWTLSMITRVKKAINLKLNKRADLRLLRNNRGRENVDNL